MVHPQDRTIETTGTDYAVNYDVVGLLQLHLLPPSLLNSPLSIEGDQSLLELVSRREEFVLSAVDG